MKLIIDGTAYAVTTVPTISDQTVRVPLDTAPPGVGADVELVGGDGLHLRTWHTADWMRAYIDGTSLVLTQTPEPTPVPAPTPTPQSDPIADHDVMIAELTQRIVNLEIGGN